MSTPIPVARFVSALLVIAAFAFSLFGQNVADADPIKTSETSTIKSVKKIISAPNALVDPVVFNGQNINCANLDALHANGVGDIRFSHIINNNELKLNFSDPNGTFPFTNNPAPFERIVVGPQDATKSVTVTSSSNPGLVSSWSSQIQITAVIVKVGNTSYVYPYKPFKMSDTDLVTGDPRGISHLTFCFGDPTNPTAADASISGHVVDANGMGISKAQLVLINGATGEARITMTSPFGYYTFSGLEVNELYVINVSHKRYAFPEKQRVVSLTDDLTGMDFVGSTSH